MCTVLYADLTGEGLGDSEEVIFEASSPDEECLVSAASHLGYTLARRAPTSITLEVRHFVSAVSVRASNQTGALLERRAWMRACG